MSTSSSRSSWGSLCHHGWHKQESPMLVQPHWPGADSSPLRDCVNVTQLAAEKHSACLSRSMSGSKPLASCRRHLQNQSNWWTSGNPTSGEDVAVLLPLRASNSTISGKARKTLLTLNWTWHSGPVMKTHLFYATLRRCTTCQWMQPAKLFKQFLFV